MNPTKESKSIILSIKKGELKSPNYYFQQGDLDLFDYLKAKDIPTNDCKVVLENSNGERYEESLNTNEKFATAFEKFGQFHLECSNKSEDITIEFELV